MDQLSQKDINRQRNQKLFSNMTVVLFGLGVVLAYFGKLTNEYNILLMTASGLTATYSGLNFFSKPVLPSIPTIKDEKKEDEYANR